jgi:transcriptional regulator with XRE-family HTH domain
MKEINIANVLVNKRKEKGITQDELANYMGVSKASVSKWKRDKAIQTSLSCRSLQPILNSASTI